LIPNFEEVLAMAAPLKVCLNAHKGKQSHIVVYDGRITQNTDVTLQISDNHGLRFDSKRVRAPAQGETFIKLRLAGQLTGQHFGDPPDGTLTITLTDQGTPFNPPPTMDATYTNDATPEAILSRKRKPGTKPKKPKKPKKRKPTRKRRK
jgi:hypothetical protein